MCYPIVTRGWRLYKSLLTFSMEVYRWNLCFGKKKKKKEKKIANKFPVFLDINTSILLFCANFERVTFWYFKHILWTRKARALLFGHYKIMGMKSTCWENFKFSFKFFGVFDIGTLKKKKKKKNWLNIYIFLWSDICFPVNVFFTWISFKTIAKWVFNKI